MKSYKIAEKIESGESISFTPYKKSLFFYKAFKTYHYDTYTTIVSFKTMKEAVDFIKKDSIDIKTVMHEVMLKTD